MPTKPLPANPNLDHLKYQTKDLLQAHRAEQMAAYQRIREFHPQSAGLSDQQIAANTFTLSDAQLAIAREYGYSSWPRLKVVVLQQCGLETSLPHHERIDDSLFRQAVDLIDEGNAARLHKHLQAHPQLATQRIVFEGQNYFNNPSLLAFIAENPIRHHRLPANIVEMAKLILDAGAAADQSMINETLALVSSGCVARECGVQVPLIRLLCDYGGDHNGVVISALGHGEFEAVDVLIECGATMDLCIAAATNRLDEARRLTNTSDPKQKHMALALAAQNGHYKVVEHLLNDGEDPNRFNPEGCHSHSTPLHQAALAGQLDVVRVLVAAGASMTIGDIHHQGTALDWAIHAQQDEVAMYLRAQQQKLS